MSISTQLQDDQTTGSQNNNTNPFVSNTMNGQFNLPMRPKVANVDTVQSTLDVVVPSRTDGTVSSTARGTNPFRRESIPKTANQQTQPTTLDDPFADTVNEIPTLQAPLNPQTVPTDAKTEDSHGMETNPAPTDNAPAEAPSVSTLPEVTPAALPVVAPYADPVAQPNTEAYTDVYQGLDSLENRGSPFTAVGAQAPSTGASQPVEHTFTEEVGGPSGAAAAEDDKEFRVRTVRWTLNNVTHETPILMQNINGPCPILALANAILLKTPGVQTPLVASLRNKDSVKLSDLVPAIVETHVAGLREDQEMPDLEKLLPFLHGLYTGLNVNPCFVIPGTNTPAGVIEDSPDINLYSTFGIPLFHGWVPARDSPVSYAMARSAPTYEAAQNLFSREDEFEASLGSTEGLSEADQQAFEDMTVIKGFVQEWRSQLTPSGIRALGRTMGPGDVAILFRNDHFSTVLRHPETAQLFALVTDSGFIGFDDIVWQSVADVSGGLSEFYSGSFDTIQEGQRNQKASPVRTQQTDDDYALALSMQQEEDRQAGQRPSGRGRQEVPQGMVPPRRHGYGRGPAPGQSNLGFGPPDNSSAPPPPVANGKPAKSKKECIVM